MTDQEFNDFVRSLLNEASAVFWGEEEIALYKKVGLTVVNAQYWNFLMPFKKKIDLLNVAIGNRFIDLPTGCQKVVRIEIAETGDKLNYVQDEWFYIYAAQTPGDPNGWTFSEGKIYLFPEPSQSLTGYLRCWSLPYATTLAALPEELHPLVAIETVIAGRVKDENLGAALESVRQRYATSALKSLIMFQAQDPEIVGEVNRWEDSSDR